MKLGVLVKFEDNVRDEIKKVRDLGFSSCQLVCWNMENMTDENAEIIKESCKEFGVSISSFWCGWSGEGIWNFYEGPDTLGIVPLKYREMRVEELKKGSDFTAKIGVKNMITHAGFLPENPTSPEYMPVVETLRDIAKHCKQNGQYFLFETGQETPVTLARTIEDIGEDNLGINLDPANLILYGKANPVDSISLIGKYVRDVHGKDGFYPTDGKNLGEQAPLGEGDVNFPLLIKKLKEAGYDGPITIEREISGPQQIEDIKKAKIYLENII